MWQEGVFSVHGWEHPQCLLHDGPSQRSSSHSHRTRRLRHRKREDSGWLGLGSEVRSCRNETQIQTCLILEALISICAWDPGRQLSLMLKFGQVPRGVAALIFTLSLP